MGHGSVVARPRSQAERTMRDRTSTAGPAVCGWLQRGILAYRCTFGTFAASAGPPISEILCLLWGHSGLPGGLTPEARRATTPKKPVGSFSSAANWRRALVERAKLKQKRGGGARRRRFVVACQSAACCVTCDAKPQPTNRKSVVITEKRLERVKSVGVFSQLASL